MLLKKAIQGRGQTMKEFANEIGIHRSYLSGINTGLQRPSFLLALKIGKALNISPVTIIKFKDSLTDSALSR